MSKIQFIHDQKRTTESQIEMFLHCTKCIEEWKTEKGAGESPASYARLNIGFTPRGIQIWCERHNCNVDNIEVQLVEEGEDLILN